MLFTKRQNLSEMIISYLTYHPGSTLQELKKSLGQLMNKEISKQGWYKAIRMLLELEVIMKVERQYSLNISWADHLINLSHFIKANYLERGLDYHISLPEKEGQKIKFKFPNLIIMDAFWAHILVLIAANNPGEPFYAYAPHWWFSVAHKFEVERYFKGLERQGAGNYTIVGSQTDIDRWSAKLHPRRITNYYCSPKPINKKLEEYPLAMADYYMLAKISKDMARKIDKLFLETKFDVEKEDPPGEVIDFFKQKSPCSLTIWKDKEKAGVFARRVKRYFE